MLPSKYLLIAGAVSLISLGAWSMYYGHTQYKSGHQAGHDKATVECGTQLKRLRNVIAELNRKEQALIAQQRESYRVALDVRNKQYSEVETELTEREQRLKELMDEADESCVNSPIPDGFR